MIRSKGLGETKRCSLRIPPSLSLCRKRAFFHQKDPDIMRVATLILLLALLSMFTGPDDVSAQAINLTVGDSGISFGDSRRVNGLRFNFRDRNLREVNGVNATIWSPYEPARGRINGVALGLPVTGGRRIVGLATGILGAGADDEIVGVAFGPLGVGAGNRLVGLSIGGLGIGAGADVRGIALGGLGVGAGADVTGIMVGGLGVGAGNDVTGIMAGGLGIGSGGDLTGFGVGGLGAGAGGDVTGIMIGGVGVGAGGDVTGIMIGGIGVGAGGTVTGLAIGGVGVGAPVIRGVVLSGVAAGGEDVTGAVVAPAYFRITKGGRFKGVSPSAFNHIKGEQNGITIGLLNYAWRLNGVQLGLLNYAGNKRRLRWLPFINFNFD